MKTAVVSGANGFIGSALVKELIENGVFVYALVFPGRLDHVPKSDLVETIELDLFELDAAAPAPVSADVFFHLAWRGVAGVDRADVDAQTDNIKMTCSCAGFAGKCGCRKFVYSNSIIDDEAVKACAAAGRKPGLGNIYGIAKYAAGSFAKIKCVGLGIEYVSAKLSNVIGVGEISERLISVTLRRIFNNEPVKFTAGRQNYDFIFLSDAVSALRLIGEKGKGFSEYFIGSGSPRPLREFLLELRDIAAPGYEFKFGDVPFNGVSFPIEYFDITPLRELGFETKVSFAEAIRRNAEYFAALPSERLSSEFGGGIPQRSNVWEM